MNLLEFIAIVDFVGTVWLALMLTTTTQDVAKEVALIHTAIYRLHIGLQTGYI